MKSALMTLLVTGCAFLSAAPEARAADAPAIATIVDGEAVLIRAAERLRVLEGVRLVPEDIVETGDRTFVRIEFGDRTVVDLGASTRAMLMTTHATVGGAGTPRLLYLLSGSVKITLAPRQEPPFTGFVSAMIDGDELSGTLVVLVDQRGAAVFSESGTQRIGERRGIQRVAEHSLKAGAFYAHAPGAKAAVSARPSAEFLERLPRAFRDTLPLRSAVFASRTVEAKPIDDFTYADVEPWLKAEPVLRREFARRWRSKARDPQFRAALLENQRAHPEWNWVLFPKD
ncbi:MAG: hypothetical protein KJZ83_06615 [Burkholderiaceae bacterium]|nr:hypothetical protein [Burkholderiaceae bacterium]